MKRPLLTVSIVLCLVGSLLGQPPVSDDEVIPVGLALKKELRLQIISGGSVEFVFSTIENYRSGINSPSGAPPPDPGTAGFYQTELAIVSTTNWDLFYGGMDLNLQGTFDPGNTLSLNNIGWEGASIGNHSCGGGNALDCSNWNGGPGNVQALEPYPSEHTLNNNGNIGDASDNNLLIKWEAGTNANGTMAPPLIDQNNVAPDRYVTNVIFDLRTTP